MPPVRSEFGNVPGESYGDAYSDPRLSIPSVLTPDVPSDERYYTSRLTPYDSPYGFATGFDGVVAPIVTPPSTETWKWGSIFAASMMGLRFAGPLGALVGISAGALLSPFIQKKLAGKI